MRQRGARFNVERVPRLPTFPARWVLEDRRGRPYLVFWTTDAGRLRYPLHVQRIDSGEAVRVTKPSGANQRLEIVRRPSPNGTGTVILYRCPICKKPRRYLYRLVVSGGQLTDCFGLHCQVVRQPLPRSPWDPRAVSDPTSILDEFPGDLIDDDAPDKRHEPAATQPAPSAEDFDVASINDMLDAALAAEGRSDSLSGMPWPRRKVSRRPPTSEQQDRATEAVRGLLADCFAGSPSAVVRSLLFMHRVLG